MIIFSDHHDDGETVSMKTVCVSQCVTVCELECVGASVAAGTVQGLMKQSLHE